MARIAVAATAPFGADVLERLAAHHEIAALLTRPDAPRGRGRRLAPPPAKVVAERLGVPVLQPERPGPGSRPRRGDRRRLRLRAPHPRRAARGAVVAQRPPVAPAALAWRRARRARDPRRRHRDGRHDPRDREGARRRAGRGAASDSRSGPTTTRARCSGMPRRSRCACSTACSPSRARPSRRRPPTASPMPPRSRPADRLLDLERPADELVRRVRALSPHIGARAELHGRPVTVWRARVGESGAFEPVEVQPDGGKRMDAAAWLRGLR